MTERRNRFDPGQRTRQRKHLRSLGHFFDAAYDSLAESRDVDYQAALQSLIGIARLALANAWEAMPEFNFCGKTGDWGFCSRPRDHKGDHKDVERAS